MLHISSLSVFLTPFHVLLSHPSLHLCLTIHLHEVSPTKNIQQFEVNYTLDSSDWWLSENTVMDDLFIQKKSTVLSDFTGNHRSIFTVLSCLTLSTLRLTFFWSLHRSSSLISRRLAAVAHCGARWRMRRFMKLSDSFPAPTWSKSTERSVRKAAWEDRGEKVWMKKDRIEDDEEKERLEKINECFKSSKENSVVESMPQQYFSLGFSSTLKDLQQSTCLLLLLWQKSMCPPPRSTLTKPLLALQMQAVYCSVHLFMLKGKTLL